MQGTMFMSLPLILPLQSRGYDAHFTDEGTELREDT